ncbi:cholesterol oxidase substrate-binding domain-containing protein [Planosporangium sp. 12N6]|uniref:cholesterol oxidase substrate-binding domain-containing protein n=1 Tax=Planosporangium spinosum TaxID=3402278 RepID=UPI003CF0F7F3
MTQERDRGVVSRRQVLTAAATGVGWTLAGRVGAASAAGPATTAGAGAAVASGVGPAPADFPAGIEPYRQVYRNWAGELVVDDVWTCAPGTPDEVVTLANWAHTHGYTLRAQGFRHGWSPLTVTAGGADRVVLVDTTRHLTGMSLTGNSVRVQAGAAMEDLLGYLERAGRGLLATPAPGDLSVGGALAVDGHGTAVPADGETRPADTTYGSLSNLILSLTAVVWDPAAGGYVLRTFDRAEPDCGAFLTHLGRAFVTEVVLRVGADRNLRCVSQVDVPAAELFAAPGSAGRTFASVLDATGRAEAIWFAFTANPWLKTWRVSPARPPASRPVSGPYNYPFSDNVPRPVAELAGRVVAGEYYLAPVFGQAQYDTTVAGLAATASADLWGASKNLLLYIKPTTMRMHANGYAVLCARADVQRVVHEFTRFYSRRLDEYAAAGRFPVNGALEIRVTGLDRPGDTGLPGAVPAALSALSPRPDHPDWDVAVWFDVLTLPGTAYAGEFYREVEQFLFTTFAGSSAATRVEWSKGWGYTDRAAWSEPATLTGRIPASFPAGPDTGWRWAVDTLDRYDPHRVFTNPFLDALLS